MRILKLLFIITLLPCYIFAQSSGGVLKGVITDKDGPVIGATIYLQNESLRAVVGTITSYQGDYLVVVPESTEALNIVISFIGYKTQTIPYNGQTNLDVVIEEDAQAIAGVEIVTEAQKTNMMGINVENLGVATEVIDITQFEDVSATSVEEILQGRLANVDIVSVSGDPGAVTQIRIRGDASFNESNEPLIVIDGIPQTVEIDDSFDFGDADVDDFGALLSISPDDIQTIEVLKDAAATSLWGDDAANGVLLVTTKQGGNYKPRFNISQKFNSRFEPRAVDMLNASEFTTLMQDAMWNQVRDNEYSSSYIDNLTSQLDILYDPDYVYFDEFNVDTDWLDLVTRNSVNNTTTFSMSGGGDKATYRFSLSYEDQIGTTIGTDYVRITSRLNLNYQFSKKFAVQVGFSYTESDTNAPLSSPRTIAISRMPNMSPYVIGDDGEPTTEYFAMPDDCIQASNSSVSTYNPVALAYESNSNTLNRKLSTSLDTNYTIARGLKVYFTGSFDMTTTRNATFLPESATSVLWSNNVYNRGVEGLSNTTQMYMRVRLNYSRSFNGGHSLTLGLNETVKAITKNSYSITTSGNGAEEVAAPSSGGKITAMSSGRSETNSIGVTLSLSYDYKGRFSLNPSARLSANSNQGASNNFKIPRPSLSGVWKAHNEAFIKKIKWIESLRVRYSFGESERTPSTDYVSGSYSSVTDYMSEAAIAPSQMQLNNLLPEVVTQLDLGIDLTTKSGITVSADWYDKQTDDLLQTESIIQSSTGYSTIQYYNSGSMRNRGWEFSISLPKIIKAGKFQFGINNFNLSRNVNMILELPYNMDYDTFTLSNSEYARKIVEGTPFGSIYGFDFLGIYQNYEETYARDADGKLITDINGNYLNTAINGTWYQRSGDSQYSDVNYDGVIDEYDLLYIGNSRPTVIGGASLSFKYSNWSFRMSFQWRLGQSIVNMTRHTTEAMDSGDNQSTSVLNRWRYEGDITEIPRALWGTNYNSLGSDKFVEDASYLKAREATLKYSVPATFSRKLGLTNVSAYVTASNLFTITNYSGQDPEVSVTSGAFALAIDNSETPPARRLAVGVSFGF